MSEKQKPDAGWVGHRGLTGGGPLPDPAKRTAMGNRQGKAEALQSTVFFSTDYGRLGRVIIILPENNGGDDQFDADFEETLAFVKSVMMRRKAARIHEMQNLSRHGDSHDGNAQALSKDQADREML